MNKSSVAIGDIIASNRKKGIRKILSLYVVLDKNSEDDLHTASNVGDNFTFKYTIFFKVM